MLEPFKSFENQHVGIYFIFLHRSKIDVAWQQTLKRNNAGF